MTAHLAIQCKAATGQTGTFLYVGPSGCRVPVSPVFHRSGELFKWCADNDWSNLPGSYHAYGNPSANIRLSMDGTEPVSLEKFIRDYTAPGATPPSAAEWEALASLQPGHSTFVDKLEVERIS